MTHRMTQKQKELYAKIKPYLNANNKVQLPQNCFESADGLFVDGYVGQNPLKVFVQDFVVSLHPRGLFIK